MASLKMDELLAAGAHFGHQTHKWNPRMKPYVYGERNGIYIIDLEKTLPLAEKAHAFLKKTASQGKGILFVATKRQASKIVQQAAKDCGAFYVTHRWLGGMLTNYKTISLSIDKLRKVEKMKDTGDFHLLTKKEQSKVNKEVEKLERNLGGIKHMRKVPGAIVIIDPNNEKIAIKEANNLNIPIVALTDTNCDPTGIEYVVPGNDDALKSITLFTDYFGSAIVQGGAKSKKKGDSDEFDRDKALEAEILAKYEADIDLKTTAGEEAEAEENTETKA